MKIRDFKILEKVLGKQIDITTLVAVIFFALSLSWFSDGLTGVIKAYWFNGNDKLTSIVTFSIAIMIIALFLAISST